MKVFIIGRGIVGSSLYYLFKEAGYNVHVIESGFRRFYPTLIHSLLLKGKDVELALESKKFYQTHKIPMFYFPSFTIGNIDKKIIDDWISNNFDIKEKYVDWLKTTAIIGEKTDSLVHVKKLIDSVPFTTGVAKIQGDKLYVNGKEVDADLIILTSGAWNSYTIDKKLPLKSYYCWAWATLNTNPLLDKVIIYDYEIGFYSRPLFGIGMKINIVGDGDTIVCSPFEKKSGDTKAVIRAEKRLGPLKPIYRGEGYCEGTPDMRPIYGRISDKVYIAGGLNGYGAEVGPGLAKLLFNLITKGEEEKEYLLDRFPNITDFEIGKEPHEL